MQGLPHHLWDWQSWHMEVSMGSCGDYGLTEPVYRDRLLLPLSRGWLRSDSPTR